ncbi:TAF5-like RNA polymerase II p300/CBP-associated factor-associated factor 65 kDa subunit 5L isoform X1 [Nasonia vitripennis]|uniref:TFIID subunit TAF5 NTD2 domain-containing protein n=1 Tax=Nasonia vitripennis TaxID=7425 RepID=A0A7M7LQD5_NASVI|nr:TAF5-like RNA polymerase II p300/CBP-associated factor-associated factor 65 kDa subunit 5L isoform X1 [Nasonia vitripennis]
MCSAFVVLQASVSRDTASPGPAVTCDQMKMKRCTKLDVINATVESYLKRRRYQDTDVFKKPERANCRSSEEMTLSVTAECGTSRDNSIVFSAISNDVVAADQAYQKLKHCINGLANEKLRMELRGILYPVFCHLYLEMLHAGNRQAAVQFMRSYQGDFTSDTEKDFLDELSSVFSIQDIELRPLVNVFRTRKYKVDLSDEAHIILQKFLTKYGHVILMQVINTHVTVIKNLSDLYASVDENEEDSEKKADVTINGHVEQPCGTGVDREMRELQEAIRLMRNTAHQPLRIFTVNNAIENASCGIITPNMDKLAAGFSTAEIRLWGIGETVLTRPRFRNPSIALACDPSPSVEILDEDEIDEAGAVVLRGHSDVIHDMRFIPEPEILLSVSSDKDMRAWRLNDYTCAAVYSGHNYPIWCMDTSVFNLYIATGSHDRTAKLWSLDRTFPLRIYAGHFLDVNCVRFHPNTQYLATGSSDKTVRLWNKDDGNLLRVYVGAQSTIFSVAFSPDGKYLASAGDDKSITIWDLATNAVLTELKGHQDSVMNLDWSSDGEFIASSSLDGIVHLWSTQECIKTGNVGSSNPTSTANPQIYTTNCSSILSLRYYNKNNSLVCIGTT